MNNAPETRISLVLRLKHHDDVKAWDDFVAVYGPVVYRLARAKGLQDADATDVTQEVLNRVAQAIDKWNPDRSLGSFRGWLGRIARNMVVQFLRDRNRRPLTCDDSQLYQLMKQVPDRESREAREFDVQRERQLFHWAARRIQSHFDDRTWQAFWQTAVQQRAVAEVAETLDMSRGAIYVARSRIMARLRETIQYFDALDSGVIDSELPHAN